MRAWIAFSIIAVATSGCGGGQKTRSSGAAVRPDDLWRLAPKDAMAGLVVSDAGRASDAFRALRQTLEQHPAGAKLTGTLSLDTERWLGADFRTGAGLRAAGIDPSGGLAVFVAPGGGVSVAATPLDAVRAEATLKRASYSFGGLLGAHDRAGRATAASCQPVGKRLLCGDPFAVRAGAAVGQKGGGGIEALLAREVPAARRGGLFEWFQRMPPSSEQGGMASVIGGATLMFAAGDVGKTGGVSKLFFADAGKSELASLVGRMSGGAPGVPGAARKLALASLGDDGAALIAASIDFAKLWTIAQAMDARVGQARMMARQLLGIDLERDFVEKLTGDVAVVAHPADGGYGAIIATRDAASAQNMVDKVDSALRQASMLLGIFGGGGIELKRSDAKDVAEGARRITIKADGMLPPELTDATGRMTLILLAHGDTVIVSRDAELVRRAVSRGERDAKAFLARVRAGRPAIEHAAVVVWSELADPLESVDRAWLGRCAGLAPDPACKGAPLPLQTQLLERFTQAELFALVEAVRYLLDRGEEAAFSLEIDPLGVAAVVELAWGGRTGDAGAGYASALGVKYRGDFDGYRTQLFGLAQKHPGTSVAARARLTTERPIVWSPIFESVTNAMLALLR